MNMHKKNRGFTLIELMIVVAIIGLLAAIAYPTYISQVRQSRRTDAVSLLMRAANRQERFYTTSFQSTGSMQYAGSMNALGLPDQTENGWYNVAVTADANGFTITATAVGDQQQDICTTFTINELGEKTASSGGGTDVSQECW